MTDRGRAVIYTRISRDEEGNRVGVERQEADCRDLAKRLGVDVAHVYTDNDIGASSLSKKARPAYAAMLAAVRAGEVSTVLSYSNSRLTRRPAEWIELINLANEGKLQIRTVVSGTYDLGTADGRAVAITVAAWDGAEAERIGERLEAAHRHLALRGEPFTGGRRAFGWKEDRRTIEPQEAELIREAVERVKAGWGVNTIARDWNERGIRTPWGGEWKFNNLHEVLTRPRTAGLRTLKKELVRDADGNVVKGKWQPIITTEEREEVLALLAARARPRRRRGKYLLGSLLRCGDCGAKMWGNLLRARNSTNYQCARGGHLAISGKRLEEAVQMAVGFRLMLVQAYWSEHEAEVGEPEPFPEEDRIAELTENSTLMMRDYYANPRLGQQILAQVEKVQEELEELERERALWNLKEERKTSEPLTFGEWMALTQVEDDDEAWASKRAVIEAYCDHIIIKPTYKGSNRLEERISVVWSEEATPWGEDGTPPRLPWQSDEEARVPAVEPASTGPYERWKSSPHLPAILDMLREDPRTTGAMVAEATGLTENYARSLLGQLRVRLADNPDFELPPPRLRLVKGYDKSRAPKSTRVPKVAAMMREHPDWSGRRLARELGLSHSHVQTLMREAKARASAADEISGS